jgi:PRTRC genetic system ThiF family protein
MSSHLVNPKLMEKQILVDLYGVGGTGCHVLSGLYRIDRGLRACQHEHGLRAMVYDPDRVSHANLGRQPFHVSDVGDYKAKTLVERNNMYSRSRFGYQNRKNPGKTDADIIISCVDSGKSRESISKINAKKGAYVIDCGNDKNFGNVFLGQFDGKLPLPYEEEPDLLRDTNPNEPSCSEADALGEQDMFVNQAVATVALQLVWSMLRHQRITVRGAFINLNTLTTNPINI